MKKQMTSEEAIKRWDLHAEAFTEKYDEHGGVHREVLLNPTIFSLVEEVEGNSILDAGCGEGYLSRILAKKGAIVTAVDYSKNMLEIARRRTTSDLSIEYHHGNCEKLDFLKNSTFDMIVSNMVMMDLADYGAALNEMHRLLKEDGYFIFSILHPCFVTPKSWWVRDSQGRKQYWRLENYFHEGVYEQMLPVDAEEKVVFYHRTLTSYFKTFQKTGFILEELIEPKPSEEMLEKYPSFEEDLNFSNFIVFKLRK
ncbi:class I SAM-dependent methyltransferase [Cytobacillus suaedae]|nr:class I SAM-dependent methyltransferase [Cytobacillus suaedae]